MLNVVTVLDPPLGVRVLASEHGKVVVALEGAAEPVDKLAVALDEADAL